MSKSLFRSGSDKPTENFTQILPQLSEALRTHQPKKGHGSGRSKIIEQAFEEARQAGFEAGQLEGAQKAMQEAMAQYSHEIDQFAQSLQEIYDRIDSATREWYQQSEVTLAELAVSIAEKILRQQLTLSRESILEITCAAVQEVADSLHIRIRVNPFDVHYLEVHKEQILSVSGSLRGVEIVADPAIWGGCLIETDGPVIDATFENMLRKTREAFQEEAA